MFTSENCRIKSKKEWTRTRWQVQTANTYFQRPLRTPGAFAPVNKTHVLTWHIYGLLAGLLWWKALAKALQDRPAPLLAGPNIHHSRSECQWSLLARMKVYSCSMLLLDLMFICLRLFLAMAIHICTSCMVPWLESPFFFWPQKPQKKPKAILVSSGMLGLVHVVGLGSKWFLSHLPSLQVPTKYLLKAIGRCNR